MGLLFWFSKPRNLLLLAGLLIVLRYWTPLTSASRRWYNDIRYPHQPSAAPGGKEIMEKIERSQAQKVLARHRRLSAAIQKAGEEGLDVSALQAKADAALSLNVPDYRQQAVKALNEVEMRIPRKRKAK